MAALPFKVKAVYEYKSPHEDDLDFANGTIITVTEEEGDDWYVGEYTDDAGAKHDGLFPRNFVEKYEPAAPPRPVRTRTKKETAPPLTADPVPTETVPEPDPQPVEPQLPISETVELPRTQTLPTQAAPEIASVKPVSKPESPKPATTAKPAPPPVSEKPSSFKDRIAAFNKPSTGPVAPIKPGPPGAGSNNNFIKKPFVAPPPARNAYVPPPREPAPVQKTYRREEDPEILERQRQDEEAAEKAGLVSGDAGDEADEGAKSTSLKDRIAALQKQQQEQAARRAEAVQKEKPKRPQKKRTESGDTVDAPLTQTDPATPDDTERTSPAPRQSGELTREVPRPPVASARRPSRQAAGSPSDGNEADQSGAGDTTEDGDASSTEVEDVDDRPQSVPQAPSRTSTTLSREIRAEPEHIAEDHPTVSREEEGEDEEAEMDDETRRKEELRARMAKMSGGMGMPGMFSMPSAGALPKKRASGTREDRPQIDSDQPASPPPVPASRMPMVPAPSLPQRTPTEPKSPEVSKEAEGGVPLSSLRDPEEVPDVEDLGQTPRPPRSTERPAPPLPQDRPLPSAPPSQPKGAPSVPIGRPVPPPPPREPQSVPPRAMTNEDLTVDTSPPPHPIGPRSPPAPGNRTSQILEPTSPLSPSDKRSSRAVPPIPTMPPAPPTLEQRPPPPPPPTAAPPSRRFTEVERAEQDEDEERDSEYEGDYDTDIASGASHRNALNKLNEREPSIDGSTLSDETRSPVIGPPPVPIHRGVPPPPPHQAPPIRPSGEAPRAPPPIPAQTSHRRDDSYDPYRYSGPTHGISAPSAKTAGGALQQESDPALYGDMPVRSGPAPELSSPPERSVPIVAGSLPRESREAPRQSLELPRQSMAASRRSTDQNRPTVEHGCIAQDVDLGQNSMWWTQAGAPPPLFSGRSDILCDFDEQTTARRGGRTTVSRDVYVLFQDYSQTVVTARFDPKDPGDVSLEQRHEPPAARLRQDQLEAAHAKLGPSIAEGASKRNNNTVGDGSPQALIVDILQTIPNALLPVGTRAYGALVYTNMANATVQQFDEIRPGDIISFRNAKFSGKHGPVHTKYSEDVGKPEHVGIVSEWDGTKKKIRAFEQGRDVAKGKGKTKVELQSSRLADLRSGEVKVWRVMEKSWVGWDQ